LFGHRDQRLLPGQELEKTIQLHLYGFGEHIQQERHQHGKCQDAFPREIGGVPSTVFFKIV
jgi:hypothetical protein